MSQTIQPVFVLKARMKATAALFLCSLLAACGTPGLATPPPVADAPLSARSPVAKPNPVLHLRSASLDPSNVAFRAHNSNAPFGNYLAVAIDFAPVSQLRKQLERETGQPLNHRGEAHITVITPPEYNSLADYVSIDLLNQRYSGFIQHSEITPVCIGRSRLSEGGKLLETWYLVIESEDLRALRTEVEHLYYERGGLRPAFTNPYHPHITIGFSARDLYAQDGAVKDDSSCVYTLQVD